MGYPHDIKVRAGPNLPPAQRRPGPAPSANVPARLKIIVILPLGRHAMVSPPFHPGAKPSVPAIHHSRARPRRWTESRCDSVCLRSRHFVARPRPGLAHNFLRNGARARGKHNENPRNITFYALKPP